MAAPRRETGTTHDEASLSFEALEQRYAIRPQDEIEGAFNDLCAEMLLLLARFLGQEVAQRLARTSRSRTFLSETLACALQQQ